MADTTDTTPVKDSWYRDAQETNTRKTWRVEVMDSGRRWILRRGYKTKRETLSGAGGNFDTLDEQRRTQYYVNKLARQFYLEQAAKRRAERTENNDRPSVTGAGERSVLL